MHPASAIGLVLWSLLRPDSGPASRCASNSTLVNNSDRIYHRTDSFHVRFCSGELDERCNTFHRLGGCLPLSFPAPGIRPAAVSTRQRHEAAFQKAHVWHKPAQIQPQHAHKSSLPAPLRHADWLFAPGGHLGRTPRCNDGSNEPNPRPRHSPG